MRWVIKPMALVLFGVMIWLMGSLSIAVGAAWLGIGFHFTTSSMTRGFWADVMFVVSWPLWLLVEG